jgi:hypothetical protein
MPGTARLAGHRNCGGCGTGVGWVGGVLPQATASTHNTSAAARDARRLRLLTDPVIFS